MSENLFAPAWARLDRAMELSTAMPALWNQYLEDRPFHTALDHEEDGVYIVRVWQDPPPPDQIAVMIGEWLYNVRSALDYIIWATAAHQSGRIPPPGDGQLQYPIYDSEAAWTANLYRLKDLAEHHRVMLKTMQPFNSDADANYLGWINRLARIDRHRHLNHLTAYIAVAEPVIAVPDGSTTTLQWGERVLRDGTADLARIVVTPWRAEMTIEVNPRIGIDPEIEAWSGSKFWRRISHSERFRLIGIFLSGEIAGYEYDCTGRSRKADLLTAEYRDECDARPPQRRRPPRRETPPVAWTDKKPGTATTVSRFDGTDFPPDGPELS